MITVEAEDWCCSRLRLCSITAPLNSSSIVNNSSWLRLYHDEIDALVVFCLNFSGHFKQVFAHMNWFSRSLRDQRFQWRHLLTLNSRCGCEKPNFTGHCLAGALFHAIYFLNNMAEYLTCRFQSQYHASFSSAWNS